MKKETLKKSALISRTIPYIKKEKPLFFLTLFLCVLAAILNASTSFILKKILDSYLPNENYKYVSYAILLFATIIILVFIFRYLFTFVNTICGMRIEKRIREDAIKKINHLPVDYFSLEPDGKIVAKITSDSQGIKMFYTKMFDIFSAIINILVVYIAIIILKPILGLVTLIIVPILLIWVTVYRKWVHKYFVDQRETGSKITGKLNENIVGTEIIQDFNNEDIILDEYRDLLHHYVKCDRRTARLNNTFGFELLSLLKSLLKIGLLVFLAYNVVKSNNLEVGLSAGLIGALVDNIDKMITPFSTIFDNLNELEDSMVGATRCYLFIEEKNDSKIFDGLEFNHEIKGEVEFKNVNFGYVKNTLVLKDFSLKVNSGETVGIVGATGAGKSSLMNLLLRYNDYESGSITIDGYEIKDFNKQSYRKNMGIVLQNPAIFSGTIKSNVTMDRDYSDLEVINALNQVGAGYLVTKYKDGIHSKVSFRGENLSLGEKQLICFARIILRNPSVLVLDEATANIDTETEERIKHSIDIIAKNRTTFIIAHRLSTIKNADKIIVLDKGNLVGCGLHDSLYETCDIYKDMYDSQFKKNMSVL